MADLVFICSPYRGDYQANQEKARKYCQYAVSKGLVPLAPHLIFPQFMGDDEVSTKLAMEFGFSLMDHCKEIWVFGETYSSGMQEEIQRAKEKGYSIRFFSEDLSVL